MPRLTDKPRNRPQEHMEFECIKPEYVVEGAQYCLTIAPADIFQFWDEANLLIRYSSFRAEMISYLRRHLSTCRYNMVIEISQAGRLHMHGTMSIRKHKTYEFYAGSIPDLKNTATVCMKNFKTHKNVVTGEEEDQVVGWIEYCMKMKHIFQPMSAGICDQLLTSEGLSKGKHVIQYDNRALKAGCEFKENPLESGLGPINLFD